MAKKEKTGYGAKDIYVLEGLDPVRKRPGMYIGSTGLDGLHHLIWEVVDNGLDEAMAGYAKNIEITLLPDGMVKVSDDGRGIPVDKHPQTKVSALETVMTTLHAGAKFGSKAYQVSGGLHGVGVSVVNALSSNLKAQVCRGGDLYEQEYSRGKRKSAVKKAGKCKKTGTTVIFKPDTEIFSEITFELKRILHHLREQAYLTSGVKIDVIDKREKEVKPYSFYFEGGLSSYVKYLTHGITPKHDNIFFVSKEKDDIRVEVAFRYTEEYETFEESFANNINTGEGGSHLTGFRSALTRALNDYAKKNNFLKGEESFTGEDVREGLTAVISVKLRDPQFEGQTKAKLGNPEAKGVVEAVVSEALADFMERNAHDARAIIEKCILASKARKAAKAARQTVLRKGVLDGLALPGKLADCSSKDPEESELYIVEGDSAGGCFSGDTKIALADGRNISFKEIVKEYKKGRKNYCYTVKKDGSIGIELIKNPRKTKKDAEVLKIVLDNNEEITCTPNHRFMLVDGTFKQAKNLQTSDSLMPLYRQSSKLGKRITIKGYEMVYQPKDNRWIFTHMLADDYNLRTGTYKIENGSHRHHLDFNKLNNNPDNLKRMGREEHLEYHRRMVKETLHRPDVIEKLRILRQTPEFREKMSQRMKLPKTKKILSENAKKQWGKKEYKEYMAKKFLEFYYSNSEYRKKNNEMLYENQKRYWSSSKHRYKQAKRVQEYFIKYPKRKHELSEKAKYQWQNKELLAWRSSKTKEQWTPEFRIKRKNAYNQTYKRKALGLMKEIQESFGVLEKYKYEKERMLKNDRSILKYETIYNRFFDGNEEKLQSAVLNYNHKIKKIVKLKQNMDVYDLEVSKTHNFALASGIFVHNSAKQGRDRRFQAILPLRGKILNVERARLDKILTSVEIKSLIIAIGAAIAEDFDIEKVRYHRIIIMTDADVDGSHIRALLLTLFYRYFRPIIEKGYLYIAQPPLYSIHSGKNIEYAYTETDKDDILADLKKTKGKKKKEDIKDEDKVAGVKLQRYKGLGEMNPDQLWNTTMSPENRVLLKVTIEDFKDADKTFDVLMGGEVAPRKKFIQAQAKSVKNLDI